MAETIPYLQMFSVACRAEARINDIPVARAHPGEQKTANVPIREYLLPGVNTLALAARPEGDTFGASQTLKSRVALFREDDWLEFDGGAGLAALGPQLHDQTPVPLRAQAEFTLRADQVVSTGWAWASAPALDPATQRGALDGFVGQLAGLFGAGDAGGLIPHFQQRFTEDATAYPALPADARLDNFRQLFVAKPWQPLQFDPARLVYRPAAGGRLVEVMDNQGLPFLRTHCDDPIRPFDTPGYTELPVMVGILQGRFAVLR